MSMNCDAEINAKEWNGMYSVRADNESESGRKVNNIEDSVPILDNQKGSIAGTFLTQAVQNMRKKT